MQPLKLDPLGDSLGIALPEAVLTRLGLGPGDSLTLSETESGYLLTAEDPEFERQLGLARQIMAERHSVLRELAHHQSNYAVPCKPCVFPRLQPAKCVN